MTKSQIRKEAGYKKRSPFSCCHCERFAALTGGQQLCKLMDDTVAKGGWCTHFYPKEARCA